MVEIKSPSATLVTECGDDLILQALLFTSDEVVKEMKPAFKTAATTPARSEWLPIAYLILHNRTSRTGRDVASLPGVGSDRGEFLRVMRELRDFVLKDLGRLSPSYARAKELAADPNLSHGDAALALGANPMSWLMWAAACRRWDWSEDLDFPDLNSTAFRREWSDNPSTTDPALKALLHGRVTAAEVLKEQALEKCSSLWRGSSEPSEAASVDCWVAIAEHLEPNSARVMATAMGLRDVFYLQSSGRTEAQAAAQRAEKARIRQELVETGIRRHAGPYWWDAESGLGVMGDDKGEWWGTQGFGVKNGTFFRTSPDEAFVHTGTRRSAVMIRAAAQPEMWAEGDVLSGYGKEGAYAPEVLDLVGMGGAHGVAVALWRDRMSNELVGWSEEGSIRDVYEKIEDGVSIAICDDLPAVVELKTEMRRMFRGDITR